MSYLGTKPANAIVDSEQIGAGVITTEKLNTSAINYVSPTGVVLPYGGSTAPTGWLLCNGSAVSRTTYADLFTALGTTYGVGDGSTTFNLPNLEDKIPVGTGGTKTRGQTGGSATVTPSGSVGNTTLALTQIPSHTHTQDGFALAGAGGSTVGVTSGTKATGSAGGGGSHNHSITIDSVSVEQPYVVLTYIIKT